jgi:dedicator of cytokinesis protein 3
MSISASTPNLALSKTSSSSKPSSIPNQTQSSPSVPPSGEFHHLFLELRACVANVCASSESCELFFSLYSKPAAQFVTEEFLVVIDDHGRPIRSTRKGEGGEAVAEIRAGGEGGEGGLTRVKALIVDLADQDVVDLVLVCRVVRCGALKMAEIGGGRSLTASPSSSPRPGTPSQSSAASYRRPVGCAVLHLNHHVQFSVDDPTSKPTDASMPIYVPVEEGAFAGLHEDIIHGRTALYTRSNRYVFPQLMFLS